MEKNFNPIRDLRSPEVDPFNVPAGQSTQEIESIRLTLVVTREKTENLVKLLKRKGLLFKQDVEKIKELQRRLRKTIPRIPILRDDSISGSETSMSNRRRSGFDVMRGFNRRPQTTPPTTTSVPVANPFPFFEVAVAILGISGIKGIKMPKFLKNLFGKGKGAPSTIDDILKQLEKQIKELEKAKKVVPTSLRNLQKNLQLVQQNQTTASRMSSAFDKNKNKIISGKKFANKTRSEKLAKKRYDDFDKLLNEVDEYKIFDILDKNNIANPNLLKTRLNKAYGLDIKKLIKLQKNGKISPGQYADEYLNLTTRYEKAAAEIDLYAKNIKDVVGKSLRQKEYQRLYKNLQKVDSNFGFKTNTESYINNPEFKKLLKDKGILINNLNVKPMSNDIAMLNTDTRDRETIVILTDSIG